jgi:superfamily II DNA or RNA helicase
MSSTYLDINGYHIKKNKLTEKELKSTKKELTVCPTNNMYGEDDIFYEQYKENNDELIVPRYYGIQKFGEPKKILFEPENANINFISKLRDYQVPIVEKCISHIKETGGGELSVPCGRGKTVMAIYIAHKLGLKTLVIVHQSFLQDQWVERINFFTGEEVGIIRQSIVRVDNKKIVVGMIQSIASRDYGDIFEKFGLVIFDECHHYASRLFSQTVAKLGAKYTLGLSATLYRGDGLVKVVHWYLGNVAYKEKMKTNNQVVVKLINFNSKNKLFKETTRMVKGIRMPNCTKMLNNLVDIKSRDSILVNIINTLRKDPERKILILSGRKDAHLPKLKGEIDTLIKKDREDGKILEDECKTYYYTGDCNRKERFEAEQNADIIFATYHMAQEGLDIPRLNTVILATPKKDVVQAVGRILRKVLQNGDIRPLIIDIMDNISIFPKQANVREKFYEQNDYVIQYYYCLEDKFISPKEYVGMQGGNTDGVCDIAPQNYDEIMKVPPVEINIENETDSSATNSSSNSSKKSKKIKMAKLEELDVDDVFDLPKSKTSTTLFVKKNKELDVDDVFDLPKSKTSTTLFVKKNKELDVDDVFDLPKSKSSTTLFVKKNKELDVDDVFDLPKSKK